MGSSRDDFIKYPMTPHLFGSEGTDDDKHLDAGESDRFIADESLIVEEKIDGTNVGIHFTSAGEMVLQCRGHLITEGMHPQYDLFKQWAAVKRFVLEERLEDRFILFGEWVYARHSVHYRQLPHYFFEFDIYDKDKDAFLVPHEEYRCTVTMTSGLPGSGKDTWLRTNRPDLPVVSLDDIRSELEIDATGNQGEVAQLARERCRELLRARTAFAFNATNLLRQTRQRWVDLFADYGARIEMVYVEPPLATVLPRNRRREKPVPENVILQLASKCEPPTLTEAHGLVVEDSLAKNK